MLKLVDLKALEKPNCVWHLETMKRKNQTFYANFGTKGAITRNHIVYFKRRFRVLKNIKAI